MQRDVPDDRPASPVLILPALHFIACLIIELNTAGSEQAVWYWSPMFWVDFPFVLVLSKVVHPLPYFWTFGIFGTLCWYGVSVVFRYFYRKMALDD